MLAVDSPAHLIDIGVNLTNDAFSADLDQVLERAQVAGICHLVVTGTTPSESIAAANLAARFPHLITATAGCHPHHAAELDDDALATIAGLTEREEVVAVGECGLDYFRDLAPRDVQRAALERQLALAVQVRLPVFLHDRDAADDLSAIVNTVRAGLVDGVVHCFTGDERALRRYLDADLYIGITGWICDERRGTELAAIAKYIPDDRLLIETDAPYLIPRTLRPRPKRHRNEPGYLPEVVKALAHHRGTGYDDIARLTTTNARRLFRIHSTSATSPS